MIQDLIDNITKEQEKLIIQNLINEVIKEQEELKKNRENIIKEVSKKLE